MNKPIKKIIRPKAPVNDDEINSDELSKFQALEATAATAGGQILIDGLFSDIIDALDILTVSVGDLTHIQCVTLVSKIKEKLDIARALVNAKTNKEMLSKMLPQAIKDEANRLFEEHEAMVDPKADQPPA